jgi:hypothetical protein
LNYYNSIIFPKVIREKKATYSHPFVLVMCPQCQRNPIVNQNPNKRSISAVYDDSINRSEDNPEEVS